ncbi:MAG: protein kinase [Deltaproteobacteria bacterium]|nr:protein kinase [Deltaproteobacteria bacterium]
MNALEPGGTLGGYRILARLRAGAMGVLYLARREVAHGGTAFARPVAIKVIHEHLATNKRFVRMFIDEAKLCARIDDPNVVRVEEFGHVGGRYYLVMEYVHGASLGQVLSILKSRGGLPIPHAVQLAMQIAGGLHGAHEATADDGSPLGIVHRDVSPTNVLVSYKGYVRVIDFGVARAKQVGGQTKTGSLRGKLAYMPPEQARSARTVDRRADLYALGLVLWEMLTRRRVFDADSDIAILNQIREAKVVPPSTYARSVPRALDAVVMRMLDQDPERRQPTGAHVQRELAEAVPEALRVLPADLAVLMKKVREAAVEVSKARSSAADEAAEEGEEVVRTLAIFGANLNESVESAGGKGDGRASSHDLDAPEAPAAPAAAGYVEEDATTAQSKAPVDAPSPPRDGHEREERVEELKKTIRTNAPLRPSDGVRPLGPIKTPMPPPPLAVPVAPGSSPDQLIPPPAGSSSRTLMRAGSPSSHDLAEIAMARRSPEPAALAVAPVVSTGTILITSKQKLALAVGVPLGCALVIALAIVATSGDKVQAAPPARPQAKAAPSTVPVPETRPIPVPVVIAPPAPADPVTDAGEVEAKPTKAGKKSTGANRP